MTVKIFTEMDTDLLESRINLWLENHSHAVIHYITQSQDTRTQMTGMVVICIWYK